MYYEVIGSWTRLFKESFESAWDVDPANDLELTADQRADLDEMARKSLEEHCDRVLADYAAYILGNGEIVSCADRTRFSDANGEVPEFPAWGTDEWDELKERLSMWEFDTFAAVEQIVGE